MANTQRARINPNVEHECCHYCGNTMPRKYQYDTVRVELPSIDTAESRRGPSFRHEQKRLSTYTRGYYGHNVFCSLRCGYWWAVRQLTHDQPRQRVFDVNQPNAENVYLPRKAVNQ